MQQTETYKLNKPGIDDPLAIAPLNENMDKLEAAIIAESETRAAETAALDQRLQVLEIHKAVTGTYRGSYGEVQQTIELGFTPAAVFVACQQKTYTVLALLDNPGYTSTRAADITIVPNGFLVGFDLKLGFGGGAFNNHNTLYHYIAFV